MYNGEEITYDGIGNPLSYRGWTMSWQGGRQLSSMTNGSDTLNFVYNESGLRTSKTVNGVTHSYVWQGSKLAADITDAYALYFHYDSSGEVIGFTRTANSADTEYFYVKNFQGDILKVITATGTEVAAYTYDAWGRLLTSSGDMADVNPLRYRGYFYDTETGLYYLQSRYYDPEVSRFINPDGYATTDADGVLSANMFAYCENDPVNGSDPTGHGLFTTILVGAAIGVGKQFVADIISNGLKGNPLDAEFSSAGEYLGAAISGAVDAVTGGGIVSVVVDIVGTVLVSNTVDAAIESHRDGTSFWDAFSWYKVGSEMLLNTAGFLLDKSFDVLYPNSISDIKDEAKMLGLKGTKQLKAYMNGQQSKINVARSLCSNAWNVMARLMTE